MLYIVEKIEIYIYIYVFGKNLSKKKKSVFGKKDKSNQMVQNLYFYSFLYIKKRHQKKRFSLSNPKTCTPTAKRLKQEKDPQKRKGYNNTTPNKPKQSKKTN